MSASNIEQSDARLNHPENLANNVEYRKARNGGRAKGGKNLSPMMRNLIGAAARVDGNYASTARNFGVDERVVSHAAKGRTGQNSPVKSEVVEEMEEIAKATVAERQEVILDKSYDAISSLFDDDGPITPQNLKTLKPREAINAAKDLAAVVDRVTPKQQTGDGKVNVVIFAPRVKDEKEYEAIDIDARTIE